MHRKLKILGFGLIGILGSSYTASIWVKSEMASMSPDGRRLISEQAQKIEAREAIGANCLSLFGGGIPAINDQIKENMREPDSFEHISTRMTGIDKDRKHTVFVRYRGRNGFGGISVGRVIALMNTDDCSFRIIGSD